MYIHGEVLWCFPLVNDFRKLHVLFSSWQKRRNSVHKRDNKERQREWGVDEQKHPWVVKKSINTVRFVKGKHH